MLETAEIEAEFMWGLLEPSMLSGEAGYYLTTLSSAVHVLKTFRIDETQKSPVVDDLQHYIRVYFGDMNLNAVFRSIPVGITTTVEHTCHRIAEKMRIKDNKSDYGLFEVSYSNNSIRLMESTERPQLIKEKWIVGGDEHFQYRSKAIVKYANLMSERVMLL